ncbi:MAG: dTMP kinase [Bacteroidales bacterium]|nr:dTMP kinase [Bacteroidales bacterium]MDD4670506.1 dTMP kinase [Bacteroidales bacterium]
MLIVLEGLDGAGKSTQLEKVSGYLKSKGKNVRHLHFPRFDAPVYGDLISKFLRGDFGSVEQVHPQLVALLFAEDRRDASSMIREWLNDGYCVILDRYVYSNIAFQCSKLKSREESDYLREWIFEVEYNKFVIPKPDLNLFLDVPITFVRDKLTNNREGDDREYLKGKSDIHEASIELQKRVREIYIEQCSKDKDFINIDCSDSKGNMLAADAIFSMIQKEIDNKI